MVQISEGLAFDRVLDVKPNATMRAAILTLESKIQVSVNETRSGFLSLTKHLSSSMVGDKDIMLASRREGPNSLLCWIDACTLRTWARLRENGSER